MRKRSRYRWVSNPVRKADLMGKRGLKKTPFFIEIYVDKRKYS